MESIRNPLPKPPKYIDVDYMTLPDIDSNPLFYDEDAQELLTYWTDGKMVYWYFGRASRDVEHFVWFNQRFAKDRNTVFSMATSCGMWITPHSRHSTTATPGIVKVSGPPAAGLNQRTSALSLFVMMESN